MKTRFIILLIFVCGFAGILDSHAGNIKPVLQSSDHEITSYVYYPGSDLAFTHNNNFKPVKLVYKGKEQVRANWNISRQATGSFLLSSYNEPYFLFLKKKYLTYLHPSHNFW